MLDYTLRGLFAITIGGYENTYIITTYLVFICLFDNARAV